MRKWCLTLAIGGPLALPLYAQQKYAGSGDEGSSTAVPAKSTAASHAAGSGEVAPANGVFALSAAPRSAPFPGASAAAKGTRPPGMLAPRYELAGMYQYVNFAPGDPFANFNNHGATGSFTYNPSSWLGLTAEFGSYAFKRVVSGSSQSGEFNSYLFGPRLSWRHFDHLIPFGEFLDRIKWDDVGMLPGGRTISAREPAWSSGGDFQPLRLRRTAPRWPPVRRARRRCMRDLATALPYA